MVMTMPEIPITTPINLCNANFSSLRNVALRITPKIAAHAFNIEAKPADIVCCPEVMSENGNALARIPKIISFSHIFLSVGNLIFL